jgi:hypothetical protein
MARQTSPNHKGYVTPQSFPPLPEVYEEVVAPTNLDHAQILQVGQPLQCRWYIEMFVASFPFSVSMLSPMRTPHLLVFHQQSREVHSPNPSGLEQ